MTASQYVGIGIIAGYWIVLITTRWMFIARPNRRFTLARIDDAQYFLEPDAPSLLDEARAVASGTHVFDDPHWRRAGLRRPPLRSPPPSTRPRKYGTVSLALATASLAGGPRPLPEGFAFVTASLVPGRGRRTRTTSMRAPAACGQGPSEAVVSPPGETVVIWPAIHRIYGHVY
jgi:hypothetical protein